jgi:hypothetical protein
MVAMNQTRISDPPLCAGCEIEVAWTPIERGARAYCCEGCAAGGPCCCSYDCLPDFSSGTEDTMPKQRMNGGSAATAHWLPMSPEAFQRVEAEINRLIALVGDSQSTAWEDSISGEPDAPTFVANGELHLLIGRLEKLRSAFANAYVVQPDGEVVVGSHVTISDPEEGHETYTLVAPGEADARAGRISPDSPLGAALLGRRAGDVVNVATSDGTHRLTVVSIE